MISSPSLASFINRLRDLQPVTIRVLDHILAGIPRAVGNLLDDLRAALAMVREGSINILDPEQDLRMQIAVLELRRHARSVLAAGAGPTVYILRFFTKWTLLPTSLNPNIACRRILRSF